MSLTDHARRELDLLGEDPAMASHLVTVIGAFAAFGHSGGSAEHALGLLERLLRFKTLTPLTDDPEEWLDRAEESGVPLWQSARDPAVFSADRGVSHYRVDKPSQIELSAPARRRP